MQRNKHDKQFTYSSLFPEVLFIVLAAEKMSYIILGSAAELRVFAYLDPIVVRRLNPDNRNDCRWTTNNKHNGGENDRKIHISICKSQYLRKNANLKTKYNYLLAIAQYRRPNLFIDCFTVFHVVNENNSMRILEWNGVKLKACRPTVVFSDALAKSENNHSVDYGLISGL